MDEAYWRLVVKLELLLENGMIDPADLDLFGFAPDAEGAWTSLLAKGLWSTVAAAPPSPAEGLGLSRGRAYLVRRR